MKVRNLRWLAIAVWASWAAVADAAEPLRVSSVLVTALENIETPAQEAGLLVDLSVREGAIVRQDDLLGRIDDAEIRLEYGRAEIELRNARRQAENDIEIRVARKAAEVAQAELTRAVDARKRYPKSISEAEIDRLRLAAEKAELDVEQAVYKLETAKLKLAVDENDLARVQTQLERRQIRAPLDGRVVQILRRRGEWVQPGQTVLRIVRLDRLKAVGFLDAKDAASDLEGRPVNLVVDVQRDRQEVFAGKITFVNSEANPVNGQVDVWAEIDNRQRLLRPGLHGTMTIEAAAP